MEKIRITKVSEAHGGNVIVYEDELSRRYYQPKGSSRFYNEMPYPVGFSSILELKNLKEIKIDALVVDSFDDKYIILEREGYVNTLSVLKTILSKAGLTMGANKANELIESATTKKIETKRANSNFYKLVDMFIESGHIGDYNPSTWSITLYDIFNDPKTRAEIHKKVASVCRSFTIAPTDPLKDVTNIRIFDIDL